MALNFGPDPIGSNVIAQGVFFHAGDATPDGFFTHWSATSSVGTTTLNITNLGAENLTVRILRVVGEAIIIEISPGNNNRSVTVPNALALQVQEETVDVDGEYLIVKH